jgi:hypothetical protein
MKHQNNLTEITGPTCSGKSYYLSSLKYKHVGYIYLPVGFLFLLTSPILFYWLFIRCLRADRSLLLSFLVFLNVFAKVGFSLCHIRFFKFKSKNIIVDEGLSHIPFILMLNESDIDYFIKSFLPFLSNTKILMKFSSSNVISKRLKSRGHKRVKSKSDHIRFVNEHVRVQNQYCSYLKSYGLKFEII